MHAYNNTVEAITCLLNIKLVKCERTKKGTNMVVINLQNTFHYS